MWATIAIIFVSLLVGYIISNKGEKTLSETWREEHKNNAENRLRKIRSLEGDYKYTEFFRRSPRLGFRCQHTTHPQVSRLLFSVLLQTILLIQRQTVPRRGRRPVVFLL